MCLNCPSRYIFLFIEDHGPNAPYSPIFGVDKNWHYEASERDGLTKGQIILLGTDGIWETINPKGEMFGKHRLYEIIRRKAQSTATGIQTAVLEALGDFRGKRNQEDDITMVVIKVK